jgi:hypothetical protein
MTLTAVGRVLWGPGVNFPGGASMAASTLALNDADNAAAGIHRLPKAGSIDRVIINLSAKGTNSTTILYNIGIVTVDSSGNPTTTPYGGSALETRSVTALATGQNIITLATPATGVAGDVVGVRVWPEGTVAPNATNNVTIRTRVQSANTQVPYANEWATAWTKSATYPLLTAQYATADGGTYVGLPPSSSSVPATAAFGSGSTPNEIGALFQVPVNMTVVGAGYFHRQTTLAATGRLGLYDNAGTLQRSGSYPAGAFGITSTYGVHEVEWAGYDLTAATNYRLGHLATSADTRQHLEVALASSGQRASLPQGASWQRTSRTNSADTGAWTDVDTTLPLLYLIVSHIDLSLTVGGGGGGGQGAVFF